MTLALYGCSLFVLSSFHLFLLYPHFSFPALLHCLRNHFHFKPWETLIPKSLEPLVIDIYEWFNRNSLIRVRYGTLIFDLGIILNLFLRKFLHPTLPSLLQQCGKFLENIVGYGSLHRRWMNFIHLCTSEPTPLVVRNPHLKGYIFIVRVPNNGTKVFFACSLS